MTGDFLKQLPAMKETEAARGRLLKGRQILFKLNEYFGIQEAEDRALSIESLVTSQLQGNDLRGSINQGAPYLPLIIHHLNQHCWKHVCARSCVKWWA